LEQTALVGEHGELDLSAEQRRRWGLAPGAQFLVRETPEGLHLRPLDPPLARVYVEPTNACNLQCRACVRNAWDEPTGCMSMATYQRLVDGLREVPSLSKVSFWGLGEPLLHPHIAEMVAQARSLGARTELVSNGLLLDRGMARRLIDAGLDTLVVSIDGASPAAQAEARSGADLNTVKRNVQALLTMRHEEYLDHPEVGIEFVLTKRNVSELSNLRSVARSLGASFVVISNLLPYTREFKEDILYWLSVYPSTATQWSPKISLPRIDAHSENVRPLLDLMRSGGAVDLEPWGSVESDAYCRFVGEGSVAVGWNGDVSPCVALMHSYPCYVLGREKTIRRYVTGNAGQEDIRDIWRRDSFAQFRARVQRFDFAPCTQCGGCTMVESNEEDCFGNTFPVCGDCLWARGIIRCP
jgi:MoaA/NifB/PqqE/SkfB family radical SAM enzyme